MEFMIVVKFVLAFVVGGLFSFVSTRAKSGRGLHFTVILALVWALVTAEVVCVQAFFWMFDMDMQLSTNIVSNGFSRQACIFFSLWSGLAITFWVLVWLDHNK